MLGAFTATAPTGSAITFTFLVTELNGILHARARSCTKIATCVPISHARWFVNRHESEWTRVAYRRPAMTNDIPAAPI